MVSVVVVAHNVENYIKRCIDSLRKQTFNRIKIIIVDSDSTDRTGEICKEYAAMDSRITYVWKKNEGPGPARTLGLQMAKHTYITFVDGDDWLEPDAIMNMKYKADITKATIVVGDIWYVYENYDVEAGKMYIDKHYSKIRFNDYGMVVYSGEEFLSQMNICRTFTWGKLYRRKFLLECGFEQGSYTYEDVATVPYILAASRSIAYVDKPVYNYLKNRSTSLVNDENKAEDMLIALQELYDKFDDERDLQYYGAPLKRLMWGQIRFVCLKHPVAMERRGMSEKTLYEKLIDFMKEKFSDFISPDQCDVKVYNAKYAGALIRNILIDNRRLQYITDNDDTRKRILVVNGEFEREYCLDNVSEQDVEDESTMWDIVDDIFKKIWC